jgi:hypothetical protein
MGSINNSLFNEIEEDEVEDGTPFQPSPSIMNDPFDPKKIDITTKQPTLDLLIKRLGANPTEIDLYPDFQRKDSIWDVEKQSRLIESILISFPLPAFYFDGTKEDKWLVIDGLQRLSTLKNFIIDKTLKLTGLEFLGKTLEGKYFNQLDRTLQRKIEETQVVAYITNPGTPEDVKYNIFKRINTGGLTLTPQEIRHALNQGIPAQFVKELADTKEFKEATGNRISSERMMDREFVTRFLAFYLNDINDYKRDMDLFMNQALGKLKFKNEKEREKIKSDFKAAMELSQIVFKNLAFQKLDSDKNKINRSLFEVWSVELAKLTLENRKKLILKKDFVYSQFKDLFRETKEIIEDNDLQERKLFHKSISSATNQKERVLCRFKVVRDIIGRALNL